MSGDIMATLFEFVDLPSVPRCAVELVHDETALTQADSEFEDARANALSAGAALAFSTGSIVNEHAGR